MVSARVFVKPGAGSSFFTAAITNGANKNFTVVGQYATIRRRLFFSTQTVWFGLYPGTDEDLIAVCAVH